MDNLETRLALIHRVIMPDTEYPKEYAVLITTSRSIFIQQPKTRNSFVLRGEMRYGTALVTDVVPKTLEDYEQTSLDNLTADSQNITIPHDMVTSLVLRRNVPAFRYRDLFVWLTMRRQGHKFSVYSFEMNYNTSSQINFNMVPLGAYFKPRRMTQTRAKILQDYAMEALEIFEKVMPRDRIVKPTITDDPKPD